LKDCPSEVASLVRKINSLTRAYAVKLPATAQAAGPKKGATDTAHLIIKGFNETR
jgi:hypothetical protein